MFKPKVLLVEPEPEIVANVTDIRHFTYTHRGVALNFSLSNTLFADAFLEILQRATKDVQQYRDELR